MYNITLIIAFISVILCLLLPVIIVFRTTFGNLDSQRARGYLLRALGAGSIIIAAVVCIYFISNK